MVTGDLLRLAWEAEHDGRNRLRDALLTLAFDLMADPATSSDPLIRLELVSGLARASGLGGMSLNRMGGVE